MGGGGEGDEEDGRRILETKQGARPVNRRLGEGGEGFCFFDAPLRLLGRGGDFDWLCDGVVGGGGG